MSNAPTDRTMQRIIDVLKRGQANKRMICGALDMDYVVVDVALTLLKARNEVIILGTCKAAGYTKIRTDAPVYGLPGMRLQRAQPEPKRKSAGSGVIAGPVAIGRGYRWMGGRV